MKKTDYPNMLISLLEADPQNSERIYQEIYTALAEDFCPPFDRGALMLFALDLYILSFERMRDVRLTELMKQAIGELMNIKDREYGRDSLSEYVKLCAKKERLQRSVYFSCLRSFMLVRASRI